MQSNLAELTWRQENRRHSPAFFFQGSKTTHSDEAKQGPEPTAQPVNDIFDSVELASAVDFEEFKHFLDHVPIAIIVSKLLQGEQRVVYAIRHSKI